ncbi:MAG: HDOD domain-containing protein [Bdellovibrionales bacterium]|nr:HDOD domain-containing protein [Bdellovibrionales bacterium]
MRTKQTLDHLEKGGLPINTAVLSGIQSNLESGRYLSDRETLLSDLKSDPALYMHYLRSLYSKFEEPPAHTDPFEALKVIEEAKLKKIFSVKEKDLSIHRLSDMSKAQALRVQHSIISSSTAESIALEVNQSPGLAYSSSLLRQLALNLIAWNYPTIYSRALSKHRTQKTDLVTELQRQLGTSPYQIISRLLADWNLGPEYREAVIPQADLGVDVSSSATGEFSISQVCEIAELYSMSHDRTNYPDAEREWHKKERELKERFGNDFMDKVEEKIIHTLQFYERSAPQVFVQTAVSEFNQLQDVVHDSEGLINDNRYALRCPIQVRKEFVRLYENLQVGKVSVESVRILVEDVVPRLGFMRGCLYLTTKDGSQLKPALRFGDLPLSEYETLDHTIYSPIVDSLTATVPLKWSGLGVGGIGTDIIAGSLRALRHPGVLYFEIDSHMSEDPSYNPVLYFHAVRKAVLDCLADGGR